MLLYFLHPNHVGALCGFMPYCATRHGGGDNQFCSGENGEMLKIEKFTVENLEKNCVTDNPAPRFSFALKSESNGVSLKEAAICLNEWKKITTEQVLVPYGGKPLKPFTKYCVKISAEDNFGEEACAETAFETGRMGTPWLAEWITDGSYQFREKRVSPVPMTFRRNLNVKKTLTRARIYATAMGIYDIYIDGKRVSNRYFAPGFTSYKHTLQYQTYDVTDMLGGKNEVTFVVAGGWAVGSFVFTRKNRITADRQALLAEIRLDYEDGTSEVIGTDSRWSVTEGGNYLSADFYDGETFDASADINLNSWREASVERLRVRPEIVAEYGSPVLAHEVMHPVSCTKREDGELIFDFGQNFAGVIRAQINGEKGQKIIFRHSEILNGDGSLATQLLRSAKATATYICRQGAQTYSPRFTYMGFRYVGVKGVNEEDITLSAFALYSDMEICGSFSCSDERINKLQSNIMWSAKSNFMDIPTDCPQRDERMGWTGDIAMFAPTACFNFDMSRFLEKWLRDLKDEQLKTGGIPNTIPVQGYGFPATMPVMAVDFWGDATLLVPWAQYLARGDKKLLEKMYPAMKKYVNACRFWAGFGFGKGCYIWHTPAVLHFGDWVAPGVPKMSDWQKRSKWTATASLAHTSGLLAKIAALLGKKEDAERYSRLSRKVADAYISVFTDGNGKLKNEFQTAYVLPLAFNMFPEEQRGHAAENLEKLVKDSNYCIGTGFPGTPYILFALADNGKGDAAFRMLENDKCPSWLFEVKAGGTTIWERWDALMEDGSMNCGNEDGTGGMVSFNHYASGSVGRFLYERVAGIRPVSGGYKEFEISPLIGGNITWAKASTNTPYGGIKSQWKIENGRFNLAISVPVSTKCTVVLPDNTKQIVGSGEYSFECEI